MPLQEGWLEWFLWKLSAAVSKDGCCYGKRCPDGLPWRQLRTNGGGGDVCALIQVVLMENNVENNSAQIDDRIHLIEG